ncbi:MAG: hypothetical protein P1V81_14205 [Planctomycetota bacterium]|nr:hypothetical protein [Planctomycetota bacterium]
MSSKLHAPLFLALLVPPLSSCAADSYLGRRGADLAEAFTLTLAAGPEVSVDVQATDALHLALGGGVHGEAGLAGGALGTAGVMTLGLPVAPFLEDGVLYGRYVFSEVGGGWSAEDLEDECYLVHLVDAAPTHPKFDAWHALDLEAGFVVGVGARVGLSPGELVDFLAGLVGLDPLGDDALGVMGDTSAP